MLFFRSSKRNRRIGILFVITFAAACILTITYHNIYYAKSSLFCDTVLDGFTDRLTDHDSLFYYVLEKRGTQYVMIALFGLLLVGEVLYWCVAAWGGASLGFVLSSCVLTYGAKGTLLFLAMVLPQYVIYLPLYAAVFIQSEGMWQYLFTHDSSIIKRPYTKRQVLVRYLLLCFAGFGVLLIGCYIESYANPTLLKWVSKFF
jgi:hypothetical protein